MPLMAVCASMLLSGVAAAADGVWTVREGDTLTAIARKQGVSVEQLKRWNRLAGDVIKVGSKLHLRSPTRAYRIKKGETLGQIALRERATVGAIVKLNKGLRPNRIQAGQTIALPAKPRPVVRAKPRAPKRKVLSCPGKVRQLATHRAYRIRNKSMAWATAQTADALERGFEHLARKHPTASPVRVLDASRREGGPLGDHRSHRDFRDVDITYFQRRCGRGGCPIKTVTPSQLDVPRQWTLIRYWLENDDVQYVFVDRGLQRALYEHAKKMAVPQSKLEQWFQYPRPAGVRVGRIRHWSEHRNHLHVRFKEASCPNACCGTSAGTAAASKRSDKR